LELVVALNLRFQIEYSLCAFEHDNRIFCI